MRRRALPVLAALLALSTRAAAQDAPDGSGVPRGPGGAVIKQPDAPPAPPPGVDTMPRPLNYVDPPRPPDAGDLQPQVILKLDIDRQGHVTRVVVAEPAGHGFDESAVEAAKGLLFEPARHADGTPFAARILYRYSFALKEVPKTSAPAEQKQTAALEGTVLAAGDTPVAGATVTLRPGAAEARTDEKGAFSFPELPAGKYSVIVSSPGYQPLSAEETLAAGEGTAVKYRLRASGGALEVTVQGDRPPREVVKYTLEQREIERIPGTNGDALKSLQSLPGVARPPGVAGLLIVRGSAPQDTQTFMDGTPVPLIYHFGGLSSVVPTELLDKIDFYPGNFSAQYGSVMGGIVDVGLRNPKSEYHGLVQVDLIDARAMFEGPIPGLKGWTFLAAGRRSYVDVWAGPVLKGLGAGVTQAPVYYDYQFMVAKKPTPTSSFRISFLGSDDALQILFDKPSPGQPALAGNVGLHTGFERLQLKYSNNLENGDKINAVVSVGRDNLDFALSSLFFYLEYRALTGRFEYSKKLGKGVVLDAGLDMTAGYYDVNVRLPQAPAPGQPPNQPFSTTAPTETRLTSGVYHPAAYLEAELSPFARLRVVPGVRLDFYDNTKSYDFSPRLNARFDIKPEFPRTTVKGGVGLYYQPPQFQEVVKPFGNPDLKSNRAAQYGLGLEQEITKQLEVSVEGFYKKLDRLVVAGASPSGSSLQYTNNGSGYVAGAEVLIKYKPDARFFGWLAYTLSRSIRQDGPGLPEYLLNFDQTHILTVLGSYRLGHGWEAGARFRLISGNLVTPFVCDALGGGSCDLNRTNALFHAASGVYTPIPLTGPYSERLPLFHQLDIRIDKTWKFKTWQLSAYLDVQNAYNHGNVEGIAYNYNYTARSYVGGLPIIPNLGLRGEL